MNEIVSVLVTRLPFLVIFFLLGLFFPNLLKRDTYFGSIVPEHLKSTDEIKSVEKFYRKTYLLVCGIYTILFIIFMCYKTDTSYYTKGLLLFSLIWIIIYFRTHLRIEKIIESSLKSKVKGSKKSTNYNSKYGGTVGISKDKYIANPLWLIVPVLIIIIELILDFNFYNSIPQKIVLIWNFKGKGILTIHKAMDTVLIYPIVQLLIILIMQYFYKAACSIKHIPKENKFFLTGFIEFLIIYLTLLTGISFLKSVNMVSISSAIIPVLYIFSLIFIVVMCILAYRKSM